MTSDFEKGLRYAFDWLHANNTTITNPTTVKLSEGRYYDIRSSDFINYLEAFEKKIPYFVKEFQQENSEEKRGCSTCCRLVSFGIEEYPECEACRQGENYPYWTSKKIL